MRKNEPIRCVLLVPDGAGSYRSWNDLSSTEQSEAAQSMAKRMGDVLSRYVQQHPEVLQ